MTYPWYVLEYNLSLNTFLNFSFHFLKSPFAGIRWAGCDTWITWAILHLYLAERHGVQFHASLFISQYGMISYPISFSLEEMTDSCGNLLLFVSTKGTCWALENWAYRPRLAKYSQWVSKPASQGVFAMENSVDSQWWQISYLTIQLGWWQRAIFNFTQTWDTQQ